jgi:uncharacterized MnhB-related membrane protein
VIALQIVLFGLVALAGTCAVLVRNPIRQAILFSLYGTLLTILCVVIQSGDVALSELAVEQQPHL